MIMNFINFNFSQNQDTIITIEIVYFKIGYFTDFKYL